MYNNGCKYKILNNHKDLEQFKKDNTVDMYTVLPYFIELPAPKGAGFSLQ